MDADEVGVGAVADVLDEAADGVLVGGVRRGGLGDLPGSRMPWRVVDGAGDGPGEDGAGGGVELVAEGGVAVARAGRRGELDELDAAPERHAAGAGLGAVVAEQPDGVGGGEGEGLAVEEAGVDGVAAGELLDLGLGEPLAVVELGADDHAGAGELGELGGVLGVLADHEHLGGRGDRVAGLADAEGVHEGLGERGLAVGAEAVEEGEQLLADLADEGEADEALDVARGSPRPSSVPKVSSRNRARSGSGSSAAGRRWWSWCTGWRGRVAGAGRCGGRRRRRGC
jgi:hypothetical protein